MKTLRIAAAVMVASLIWSFALVAQEQFEAVDPGGAMEFSLEDKAKSETVEKKEKPIPNSYVVILKEGKHPSFLKNAGKISSRDEQKQKADQFAEREERKIKTLARAKYKVEESAIKAVFTGGFSGFVAEIADGEAKGFMANAKNDPDIEAFMQDFEVSVDATVEEVFEADAFATAQFVPWGAAWTGWGNNPDMGKWAWVLDTGIDGAHPDLNVSTGGYARSFVAGQTWADGHGHGTHVAGTIAARNNTIGVVGVAANAVVVPVKVLSNTGGGSWSGILQGIDWVYKYGIAGDVMNLSLGGGIAAGTAIQNFEWALYYCGVKGIHVAIAAGNSNQHANSFTPARINGPNVYTVSALHGSESPNRGTNCSIASFSNYGNPPVDYAAPGVAVYSTYPGNRYASMNGTSMASPHVAGLLLLTKGALRAYGCCSGTLCVDKDATRDRVARR